jgi:uncharacterized protein YfbU (UPF0304 family)
MVRILANPKEALPTMNLSDEARVILYNQHNILAIVEPEHREYHKRAMTALRLGYHEIWDEEVFPHFEEAIPAESLKLVHAAHQACKGTCIAFTGFLDERLDAYARFMGLEIDLSDNRPRDVRHWEVIIKSVDEQRGNSPNMSQVSG